MTEKARIEALTYVPNGMRELVLLTLADQPLE
jgi:hypothetical protein